MDPDDDRPVDHTRRAPAAWWLAALACLACDVALLAPALFTDRVRAPGDILDATRPFTPRERPTSTPANPLLGDWPSQFLPWQRLVRRSWLSGRVPLWNDLSGNGAPLLANVQCEALSPYLPLMLAGGDQFADLKQLAQLLIAQLGCLVLAHHLRLRATAACLVALAFSFSSYMQAWAMHPHSGAAAFAPLVAWTLLRLRESPSLSRVLWAAVPIAASILAGHVETAFTFTAGACLVAWLAVSPPRHAVARAVAFPVLALGSGAVAGALCAGLIAPFFEYVALSPVVQLRTFTTPTPLPASQLLSLLDPFAFGSPVAGARPYAGDGNVAESTIFVGRIALAFAGIGFVNGMRSRRAATLALACTIAVGFLLACMPAGLAPLLTQLPPLDRMPLGRMTSMGILPMALLAGLGWDALGDAAMSIRARRVDAVVGFASVGLAIAMLRVAAAPAPDSFVLRSATLGFAGAALTLGASRVVVPNRPAFVRCVSLVFVAAVGLECVSTWRDWVPTVEPGVLGRRPSIVEACPPTMLETGRCLPMDTLFHPETGILAEVPNLRSGDALGFLRRWQLMFAWQAFTLAWGSQPTASADPRLLDMISARWIVADWPVSQTVTADTALVTSAEPHDLVASAPRCIEFLLHRGPGASVRDGTITIEASRDVAEPEQRLLTESAGAEVRGSRITFPVPDRALASLIAAGLPGIRPAFVRIPTDAVHSVASVRVRVANGAAPVQIVRISRDGLGPTRVLATRDGYELAERVTALPRAYLTPAVVSAADAEGATLATRAPGFDPHRATIVEGIAPDDATRRRLDRTVPLAVESPSPQELRIAVDAPGDCVLVVTDAYCPGWVASIDGNETPIRAANVAGRAILVPAGRHDVRFEYRPRTFTVGMAVSGFTALAMAGCLLRGRRRARAT